MDIKNIIKLLIVSLIFINSLTIKQSFALDSISYEVVDSIDDGFTCKQQGTTSPGECTQQFSDDGQTISILKDGNILLTGIGDDEVVGGVTTESSYYVKYGADSAIYVNANNAEEGLSNLKIVISANSGEGIKQNMANKGNPAIYISKYNYLQSLDLNSGIVQSQDTAFFITESGENKETVMNISSGATLEGARNAVRHDIYTTLYQYIPEFNLDGSIATDGGGNPIIDVEGRNDGTTSTPDGYLNMTINNNGSIISDATKLSPDSNSTSDSANAGNAFWFGDNRIARDVTVNNNGVIEGNFMLGNLVSILSSYDTDGQYIKSSFTLVNNGTVNAATFTADPNNKVTIINNSDGTIEMEDRQYFYNKDASPIEDGYGTQSETGIRLYASGSKITNHGTFNAGVRFYSSNSEMTLQGGSYSGRLQYAGTLTLGNNLESLKGNIEALRDRYSDVYSSYLDIGGVTHNLEKNGATHYVLSDQDGTLIIKTDSFDGENTISVTANSRDGGFGRLNMQGYALVEADTTKLNINISRDINSYSFLEDGVHYTIIDGDATESGNDVNAVSDSNISVNGVSGNHYGLLRFSTGVEDSNSNLYITVNRLAAEEFTSDKLATDIYNEVIDIGSDATGELKAFQAYLDSLSDYGDISKTLKTAAPINAGDLELATLTPILNFIKGTSNRMDDFFGRNNLVHAGGLYGVEEYHITSDEFLECFTPNKELKTYEFNKDSEFCNCIFGDKNTVPRVVDNEVSVWTRGVGTYEKQKFKDRSGYRANIYGASIGVDRKISEGEIIGVAINVSQSDVQSIDKFRNTDISSYQLNIYGGKSYKNDVFWDVILGYTLNKYESSRSIPSIMVTANSSYNGNNYFVQGRVGKEYKHVNDSKINLVPELSLTYVNTNIQDYQEKNAGTMNLYVYSNTDDYLEGRAGLNAYRESYVYVDEKDIPVTYKTHLSYGYNFKNQDQVTLSRFENRSTIIGYNSHKIGAGSLRIGAGIDIHKDEASTFTVDYLMDKRLNFISHTGMLGYRYRF